MSQEGGPRLSARSLAPSPPAFDQPTSPSSDAPDGEDGAGDHQARSASPARDELPADKAIGVSSESGVEVDPYWNDGDFAFVSVDHREFRVSSTALSKQRSVHRNAKYGSC